MDAGDMHDYLDQDPDFANLGPYARFLADLPEWSDLSQNANTKAFEALPRPLPSSAPRCHHPVFRFTKQYRQGIQVIIIQQIDIAYTDIMPDIMPDIVY
jgi:hypothetical protein